MHCQPCDRPCRKHGFNLNQTRRYRCPACGATYSEQRPSLFGTMRLDEDKALMALHLLCEGSSVRSVSRVTGPVQGHDSLPPGDGRRSVRALHGRCDPGRSR